MDDQNRIPMPSRAERDTAIRTILDGALPPARQSWRSLPLSALVFGVEDCLFLALLLSLLPLGFALVPGESLAELLGGVLFLASPLLYLLAHGLTMWKESLCGTLDWKRTCRLPLQKLMALRMMLFGSAAVLVCVPVDLVLWQVSGHVMTLSRTLALSFSSLFLHAALSMACRGFRWGPAIPAAAWALGGTVLLQGGQSLLLEIPTAVFFMLAGAGLAGCLSQLRAMLRNPNKGGVSYAFR